ncbi:glycoside hydrolase family 108 protein [Acidithiobacillus albertensis]|uniref:glycoside hydrolase family 108 protein n=1 Tax=Acidithiobacillus albertensis TaxID=119978 RepID=UPI00094ABBEA|nr:glycosyl hydrolase 108 family protein [Acidithiobacillus albertensis]
MTPLQTALKFTLGPSIEGGFSDNPNDHGGPTNFGVTQATWDAYCQAQGLPSSDVANIVILDAASVYQWGYWDAGFCGQMPLQLGVAHFDWCVNHGVGGAAITLQAALGVYQDGDIGPITLRAANSCDVWPTVTKYLALREQWYQDDAAANPSQQEFLQGWLNRVDLLRNYLQGLSNTTV